MAFLERFKGRTNQLTREGICSTITNSSTPITKQAESTRHHSLAPSHKEKQSMTSPKANRFHNYRNSGSNAGEEFNEEGFIPSHTPMSPNQAKLLRLRTSEELYDSGAFRVSGEPLVLDRRANTGNNLQFYKSYAATPNHKENLINTYSAPRGKSVFGSEAMFDSPQKSQNYSPAHGQVYATESPNNKLKSLFKNPSRNSGNFSDNPYFMGSPRERDYEAANLQELRLSKFSFIERQEQLLSKYRARPDKEEHMAHRNLDMDRSPERIARGIL